ncbi:ADP-ribosylglycohydrolase family protein [Streptomyces sp. NPDC059247]|uniref:ADP-ribosylglycohydrolase family protein n=1 Tax=Streptomyces sp. NPDC059247 TaxID=3346790 RepID=UPI0036D1F203
MPAIHALTATPTTGTAPTGPAPVRPVRPGRSGAPARRTTPPPHEHGHPHGQHAPDEDTTRPGSAYGHGAARPDAHPDARTPGGPPGRHQPVDGPDAPRATYDHGDHHGHDHGYDHGYDHGDNPRDAHPDTRPRPHTPGHHRPADARGHPRAAYGQESAARDALRDRLHAAWLGRAIGCLLGKPVEKLPLSALRALARATGNWPLTTWFTARGVPPELLAAHPWNRRSATTSLAENIDGMPEDDDLDYALLNLLLLRRHGRGFSTADVARLWLDALPAGRAFTAERVAYRNLLDGVEPPLTALRRNPFREWIGAGIRADVHGWTHPGDPVAAAAQAHRDAVLTHTANGVYGAMFVAATLATAASGTADVHRSLASGLAVVPPRSRLAEAVRRGIAYAREAPPGPDGFDPVVDRLHAELGGYHWVHAVPNAALLAAALTHAEGDFSRSICAAVSGGWDTDSNGATAGSVAGLLAGHPDRLPGHWTSPLKNRLSTSVPSFDGTGFDTLAELTLLEAVRP